MAETIPAPVTNRQKTWLMLRGIKTLADLQALSDDTLWEWHHDAPGVFTAACIRNLRKWQAGMEGSDGPQ